MEELPDTPTLLIDAGTREWRCGFSDEDGPGIILPVPPGGGFELWKQQLAKAFEALEATPSEHAVVLSERPGTSAAAREAMAGAIFGDHGAAALWLCASPLFSIFNASRDTGVVVDVGERATYIVMYYEGHPVLDEAAVHSLAGGHLPEGGADASCDGLFEPSLLSSSAPEAVGRAPIATGAAFGVHEAITRTVALADVSLRSDLYANIVLVGGGSRLPDMPDRLTRELNSTLLAQGTNHSVRVVANPARGLAVWMGAAAASEIPSAREQFVMRSQYEAEGAAAVHSHAAALRSKGTLSGPLSCRLITELETHVATSATAAAQAQAQVASATRQRVRALADEAREWWVSEAPIGSATERVRQRTTQSIVRAIFENAFRQQLMGTGGSAAAVGGAAGGAAGGALAVGAHAIRLLSGFDISDETIVRRVCHLLEAEWAVSNLNCSDEASVQRCIAHRHAANTKRGWLLWRNLLDAKIVARGRLAAAFGAWTHQETVGYVRRWQRMRAQRGEATQRRALARRHLVHATWCRRWVVFMRRRSEQRIRMERSVTLGWAVMLRRGWRGWRKSMNGRAVRMRRVQEAARVYLGRAAISAFSTWRARAIVMLVRFERSAAARYLTKTRARRTFWSKLNACGERRRKQHAVLARLELTTPGVERGRCGGVPGGMRTWLRAHQGLITHCRRLWSAAQWHVEKACGEKIERWAAHVHYLKVVRRARLRRVAAKMRRGLRASGAAALRRGMSGFARAATVERLHRQSLDLQQRVRASSERRRVGGVLLVWVGRAAFCMRRDAWMSRRMHERRLRELTGAITYWRKEVQWRIQRQKWMWRQVRYMQELQTVLDQAGDGQRLAKRLLSVGVEPSAARSEQQLRVGRAAILRSTAALEKALQRDTSPRRGSGAFGRENDDGRATSDESTVRMRRSGLRVLEPGIDSYLEEYTPAPRPRSGRGRAPISDAMPRGLSALDSWSPTGIPPRNRSRR